LIHSFNGDQEKIEVQEVQEIRKKEGRKKGFLAELQLFFPTTT
jgi:hypothetical protein